MLHIALSLVVGQLQKMKYGSELLLGSYSHPDLSGFKKISVSNNGSVDITDLTLENFTKKVLLAKQLTEGQYQGIMNIIKQVVPNKTPKDSKDKIVISLFEKFILGELNKKSDAVGDV